VRPVGQRSIDWLRKARDENRLSYLGELRYRLAEVLGAEFEDDRYGELCQRTQNISSKKCKRILQDPTKVQTLAMEILLSQ